MGVCLLQKLSYYNTKLTNIVSNTYQHSFNGFFSSTNWISWHQKGKTCWILMKQEMMRWQWHQLDHVQIICTLLQTDNHAGPYNSIFYRPDALPDAQPTVSEHWRQNIQFKDNICNLFCMMHEMQHKAILWYFWNYLTISLWLFYAHCSNYY